MLYTLASRLIFQNSKHTFSIVRSFIEFLFVWLFEKCINLLMNSSIFSKCLIRRCDVPFDHHYCDFRLVFHAISQTAPFAQASNDEIFTVIFSSSNIKPMKKVYFNRIEGMLKILLILKLFQHYTLLKNILLIY